MVLEILTTRFCIKLQVESTIGGSSDRSKRKLLCVAKEPRFRGKAKLQHKQYEG
jgi:hypothetical protein